MTPKILIGGYDVTGYHNKINAPVSREILPADQFGKEGRCRLAGIWDWNVTHSGFWDGGLTTIDAVLRSLPGSNVMTVCPESGLTGESSAWFGNVIVEKYETGGKVAGLTGFTGTSKLQDGNPVINGTILKAGSVSTSANGTAYQVGAVTATQKIYAVLHVTANSGNANRKLDVTIQSAEEPTFNSPTTRLTFTQVADFNGAEYATPILGDGIGGAITDTWWRAVWARTGTSGTYMMYCIFGIL
jgi:hypothetical protein